MSEPENIVFNKKKKLTQKEHLFCLEYLVSGNATQSAIKAGYSFDSARQIGSENLSKPYIQQFLDENKSEHLRELHITAQDIIKGLHEIATKEDAKDADKINAFDKLARHINFYEIEKKTEAQKEITITYTKEEE